MEHPSLFLKQCLRVLPGIEWLQIIRLLAEADELYRQAEFFLNRHDHAAFAGAIELRDDETRERHGLVEFPRLGERVHARHGIEDQGHLMRRAGQLLADNAM